MTTITIKTKSKAGKTLIELATILAQNNKEIVVNESKTLEIKEPIYNQEFVDMVLKASKSKNRTVINPNDIWGSLGLK
jgi:hypothetical protein